MTAVRKEPSPRELDKVLRELGVRATPETRRLLSVLFGESAALHWTIRRLADLQPPDESRVPDIDARVNERMTALFGNCTDPTLLRKRRAMGTQNRLLLAVLLERLGEEVPLQELLLVNGLRNATSRRLRELGTEHGHFSIRVVGTGDATAYVLESSVPDIDATAFYWLKRNIRDRDKGTIRPHERLLALLSARLGDPVSIDDLGYVLPKSESVGRGRTRTPQLAVARRVRELRSEGWQVQSGGDKTHAGLSSSDYVLDTLTRLPAYERISPKTREEVLSHARHSCESCGWTPSDGRDRGKKQLEVHHKNPQRARPEDVHDPGNLQVLCNVCHAGVEAKLKNAGTAR